MNTKLLNQIEQISHKLKLLQHTVAVAESCTGGLLGAKLTELPGSSDFFVGGVLAYANDMKLNLLNLNPETLSTFGAVSQEAASEMASGVLELTDADWGLATTGIAGPGGGSPKKPVGLVWIGVANKSKVVSQKLSLLGNRSSIRHDAVVAILNTFLGCLNERP